MRRIYLLAMSVLALTGPVLAQEGDIVKVELMTLSLGGRVGPLYYMNSGKVSTIDASPLGISPPIVYKGARKLALYSSKEDLEPREEGEPVPKPVVMAALAKRENRALLIFADKGEGGEITLRSYGVDTNGTKAGDYRMFNFSSQKVFVIMGEDKKISVGKGKEAVVSSSKWRKEIMDMPIKMGISREGKFYTVLSKVWGHRPERRKFVFMFDSGTERRPLKVRTFYDLPNLRVIRDEE